MFSHCGRDLFYEFVHFLLLFILYLNSLTSYRGPRIFLLVQVFLMYTELLLLRLCCSSIVWSLLRYLFCVVKYRVWSELYRSLLLSTSFRSVDDFPRYLNFATLLSWPYFVVSFVVVLLGSNFGFGILYNIYWYQFFCAISCSFSIIVVACPMFSANRAMSSANARYILLIFLSS